MRFLDRRGAFTLIELLAVISIIVILIGLVTPALHKAREAARKQKARAMVSSLEVAINMYYTDLGRYPGGLDKLVNPPDNYGPYMDNKDFEGAKFMDPWGKEYKYRQPGSHNRKTFDVWSAGSGEDIGNW